MKELIAVKQEQIGGEGIKTVDARDLWLRLGSKQEFANWIRVKVIENPFFAENQDYVLLDNIIKQTSRGGYNRKDYALTVNTAKKVSMAEQTPTGDEFREYFIECERKLLTPAFNIPKTMAEALRLCANEIEQKEIALSQRDEAIRTKAHIGDKREATAMATASVARRKAVQLENELGRGQEYKCAKAIPWATDYFVKSKGMWSSLGKKLKTMSEEWGYQVNKIDNSEFGNINAYHVDMLKRFKDLLDNNREFLGKYRKETA